MYSYVMNWVQVIIPRMSDEGKGLVCVLADPTTPRDLSVHQQILLLWDACLLANRTGFS